MKVKRSAINVPVRGVTEEGDHEFFAVNIFTGPAHTTVSLEFDGKSPGKWIVAVDNDQIAMLASALSLAAEVTQ